MVAGIRRDAISSKFFELTSYFFQIKKHQQKIEMILDSKKIEYKKIDIAADPNAKDRMRELMGDAKALPPQLFNGDTYCGVSLLSELFKLLWPSVCTACIGVTNCVRVDGRGLCFRENRPVFALLPGAGDEVFIPVSL